MNTELNMLWHGVRDLKVPSHREFVEKSQEEIRLNRSKMAAHPDFTSKERHNVRPV